MVPSGSLGCLGDAPGFPALYDSCMVFVEVNTEGITNHVFAISRISTHDRMLGLILQAANF